MTSFHSSLFDKRPISLSRSLSLRAAWRRRRGIFAVATIPRALLIYSVWCSRCSAFLAAAAAKLKVAYESLIRLGDGRKFIHRITVYVKMLSAERVRD
jgi:hypothetical protein